MSYGNLTIFVDKNCALDIPELNTANSLDLINDETLNIHQFTKHAYLNILPSIDFNGREYPAPDKISFLALDYGSSSSYLDVDPNVFYNNQEADITEPGDVNY